MGWVLLHMSSPWFARLVGWGIHSPPMWSVCGRQCAIVMSGLQKPVCTMCAQVHVHALCMYVLDMYIHVLEMYMCIRHVLDMYMHVLDMYNECVLEMYIHVLFIFGNVHVSGHVVWVYWTGNSILEAAGRYVSCKSNGFHSFGIVIKGIGLRWAWHFHLSAVKDDCMLFNEFVWLSIPIPPLWLLWLAVRRLANPCAINASVEFKYFMNTWNKNGMGMILFELFYIRCAILRRTIRMSRFLYFNRPSLIWYPWYQVCTAHAQITAGFMLRTQP